MSVAVPKTRDGQLTSLVERHRNTGIQKQRIAGSTPKETIGKRASKISVDLGIWGGLDLAWISGRGRRAAKKSVRDPCQLPEQNLRCFSRKFAPESVPQSPPTLVVWDCVLQCIRKVG